MRAGLLILLSALIVPAAEIPQGSHVALKMVNSITTKTAKEGDYVYMTTATPIAADNHIVVPVGSYVQGVVSKSVRSGRISGKAELGIRIDTLTLTDGRVIRITPKLASVDSGETSQKVSSPEGQIKQGSDVGRDARTTAELSGVGAVVGAEVDRSWTGAGIGAGAGAGVGLITVLLTRGKEVELRPGATLDVVFDRAIPLN
ncbi:MAG TPA: hypothetical protein VML19_01530 [Verrucomicrobiae bacterium]|nr:hypothetical protein [Verrucomicrobiae bacterium]